jgi:hypothetical protein
MLSSGWRYQKEAYPAGEQAADDAAMDVAEPGNTDVEFLDGGHGRLKIVIFHKPTGRRLAARVEGEALPAIVAEIEDIMYKNISARQWNKAEEKRLMPGTARVD